MSAQIQYISFLVPLLQITIYNYDITINVLVVYMARGKLILMRTNLFSGPLERRAGKMKLFWALKRQVSQSRFFNLRDPR